MATVSSSASAVEQSTNRSVRVRPILGYVAGGLLLIGALVFAIFGDAPTGMVALVGDKGNANDELIARIATAGVPLILGLVVLGLMNTQWVSGASTPATPNAHVEALAASDQRLVKLLNELVLTHTSLLEGVRGDMAELKGRLYDLETSEIWTGLVDRVAALERQVAPEQDDPHE